MSDYASFLFNLSDTLFITHMPITYYQPHGSWNISPLPPELISCMISTLSRKTCEQALLRM